MDPWLGELEIPMAGDPGWPWPWHSLLRLQAVHVSVQSPAVSLCLPKKWPLLLDGAAEVSLLPALRAEHQLAEGTRGHTLGSGLWGPAG